MGAFSLRDNVAGYSNTAIGHYALAFSTYVNGNTAIGDFTLSHSAGSWNTDVGESSQLLSNDSNAFSAKDNGSGGALYQNSPNPLNTDTEIAMLVPESARGAVLVIYSIEGKQVKTLPVQRRGNTSVNIQRNELNPGIYIYTLLIDGKAMDSKRMVITGN